MRYPETPAERLRQVKAAIREPYAWPGGYPKYVLMEDGEALSIAAARENWRLICWATIHRVRDGWRVADVDINWEDAELVCVHTGELIECAYPPD